MIVEEFISKLANKFKDKKNDERNEIFREDLNIFVNSCPERHLLDVYRWVSLNHKYNTPFLLSKIYDYAKSKNYISSKRVDNIITWFKCDCGVTYSKEGRGCPKCRGHKAMLMTGESAPENMILVHEDCFYCTIYPESIRRENAKKCYGSTCSQYGTLENVENKCGKCECKECCKQMFMYNRDPKGAIVKYKTTELSQPWLIECPKLGVTVSAIIKHRGDKNENNNELL